jgi:5'-methylthioadenosine phosphorylase
MLGIIGGSGLTQLAVLESVSRRTVTTPYGAPSCALTFGRLGGCDVMFLARHGDGHTIAPHRINYRANLKALHEQGVTDVVAVATVGGIGASFSAGTIAIPDQIIDYTWGRDSTFFDGSTSAVKHIDFTQPYCETLRARLRAAAEREKIVVQPRGTYAATQGPRLETGAEVDRLARDGADLVGMTGMPEAALARELGLCYATLALVVNDAAGRGASGTVIDLTKAEALMRGMMENVVNILTALARDGG